jgi:hypothetical protein
MVVITLHGVDHLMQDRGIGALGTGALLAAAANYLYALVAFLLILARHQLAPLVAAVVGFYLALGVASSHLLPDWGTFSDPYPGLSLGAYSWSLVFAEIGIAFMLGLAGLRAMRRASEDVAPG